MSDILFQLFTFKRLSKITKFLFFIVFFLLYGALFFFEFACTPAGSAADDSPQYYQSINRPYCWDLIGLWYIAFFLLIMPTAAGITAIFPNFDFAFFDSIWIDNLILSAIAPLITLSLVLVAHSAIKSVLSKIIKKK